MRKSINDNPTIEVVVHSSLCTRCGVCEVVCPSGAIQLNGKFYPRVDWSKCNHCGLCREFCPGLSFDFQKYYQQMYAIDEPILEPEGYYEKAYIAHSNDKKIRKMGSSGGLVTQVLVYLLRKKIVDGVVLVTDNEKDPTMPIPKIAFTEGEIIRGAGSKYSVVPVNKVLKQVRKTHKKIAFVGTACHVHGLRRLQELDKKLLHNVKVVIGLACSSTLESDAVNDILWRKGLAKSEVKQIRHRNGPFPGKLTATLTHGTSVELMKYPMCEFYGRLRLMYAPQRCHLCPDYSAEFADISVADIMLRKSNGHYFYPDGRTVCLCRTDIGETLIKEMAREGAITVSPLPTYLVKKTFSKMKTIKKTL
ncbi:MAG: Coenzyme F420 hydrogenase/dehydrogenase, beta subunit C-terminal domain, partial [Thermodesulfobacteriota bacterium]|nr:Coenzyme F420 hydrogenase/dehydrogenase, beta subunit C-terminal domain [Thermodesulfobacteriota bacterium]